MLDEDEQRELLKQLRERIKQLRMGDSVNEDEEPPFFGENI